MRASRAAAGFLVAAILCHAASPRHEAAVLAKRAKRAEKKGDDAQAYIWYSEAAALQPDNRSYRSGMVGLQSRAALQQDAVARPPAAFSPGPIDDPTPNIAIDPDQVFTSLTAREFARARQPQPPPELQAKPGRQDFDITGDLRTLFDSITKAYGLTPVYDGDYPLAGTRIRFRITAADYREALRALEASTSSFVIPLSNKLLMVAKDTPQKRNDLEQTVTLVVGVPQALAPQDLTEMVAAIRQVTGVEKIAWDTAQNQVVIRDRLSRAIPAQLLLDQLVHYKSEVSIELEFLEVADSDIINYGFTITNSFSLIPLGNIFQNQVSIPSGITNLLTFGGGKTLFGIGVAQAQAMFNQTTSSARSLFRTTIRSADGQAATFHVGEKYPIITGGYYGTSTPSTAQTYSPPPSFTFEDLGIVLKITPHVHGQGSTTLAVETSYEVLAGSAINGIPIIGNRKLTTQVRLQNDEWAIIAGMLTESKQKSVSGFWGLAQIPLFGNLFKQVSKDNEKSHVLIAIRPTLLSLPPDQIVSRVLHVGTEIRPFTPL